MTFSETLTFVAGLLYLEKRVSYKRLREELQLDDETLETLRHEFIVKRLAVDENGLGLAAIGPAETATDASLPRKVVSMQEAERRQLTVMFCDLVGSTALSTRMDPEDLRDVITSFQDKCSEAIARYDGFIARYMGDGMLVYFGYPQAHEDDAERAVLAALDVVGAMPVLNDEVGTAHGVVLAVRVGIATGPVIVGDFIGEGAAEEAAVVGETPNLAARLQGLAQPNQVAVGAGLRRMLGERFELEDIGTHELKGISKPVQVWRVIAQRDAESRFDATRARGYVPLVGRQEELGLLLRSWEASKEGRGQAVLIQGEAGIGKSRLSEALREHVSGVDHIWVIHRCSPYHTNSTLYPVIEHLKRVMGWKPEDANEKKFNKLEKALKAQNLPLEEAVPLFSSLMSLPLPEGRYAPLILSPKQQREQTLDALAAWLLDEAELKPVIGVWEDLHWADPTTLELLGLYIEQSPTVSMLNVLTYRPEFVPPWSMHSNMMPITLNRMERPEVESLIRHQAFSKLMPSEVIEHIVEKADGVPLFVEELTKTVLESDFMREKEDCYTLTGPLSDLAIPATLQDSLMARLDRAPELREVAQIGAVFGREFAYEMLDAIVGLGEAQLRRGLAQLVENELLYQRGRPPRSTYIFKHALIQDAAYLSLLKRTRQQYHRQVAQLLETRFPEIGEAHPELLAHHYTEAGRTKEAIDYWYLAGEGARSRSANHEAVAHLGQGISLAGELLDEQERARCELKLQFSLGGAYLQMMGHSAPEVEVAFARARELCLRVGDAPEFVPTLFGLWRTYVVQMTDSEKPREVAAQLLRLAEEDGSAISRVVAHYAVGFTAHIMGQFSDARGHLQEGLRLYSSEDRDTAAVYRFGQDPGVACCCYLALAEWALGYPDKALGYAQDGEALARRLDDPFSVAFSLVIMSFLDQARGDQEATVKKSNKAVSLAVEKGYPYWAGIGKVMQGWGETVNNPAPTVIQGFRDRIEQHRALGTDLFAPYFLTLLGDVALKANQPDAGIAAVEEAGILLNRTGERWWESETDRLRGTLLVAQDRDSAEAEGRFEKALAVARQRDAKSFELRATVSLARLWQQQDKWREAHQLLAPIYNWFTEGHDTVDLRTARSLLDELEAPGSYAVAD